MHEQQDENGGLEKQKCHHLILKNFVKIQTKEINMLKNTLSQTSLVGGASILLSTLGIEKGETSRSKTRWNGDGFCYLRWLASVAALS